MFVGLVVEPHREEERVEAEREAEQPRDEGELGHRALRHPQHDQTHEEGRTQQEAEEPEGVEKHQRVEVADDVFFFEAPEEEAHEQRADGEDHLADLDARLLADVVDRLDRHIHHAHAGHVEPHQQVVGLAVALVHEVPVDRVQRGAVDRRVAGLRIGHMPVARGDLGEQRQDGVAEEADLRDLAEGLAGDEPVALGVVGLVVDHRVEDGGQVGGVHLAVAGHHDGDVVVVVARVFVAAGDGAAHALVYRMLDEVHAARGEARVRAHDLAGAVAALVVDDDDEIDELRHGVDDTGDLRLFVVRGHDDGDALLAVHALTRSGLSLERWGGRRQLCSSGARETASGLSAVGSRGSQLASNSTRCPCSR